MIGLISCMRAAVAARTKMASTGRTVRVSYMVPFPAYLAWTGSRSWMLQEAVHEPPQLEDETRFLISIQGNGR